MLEAPVAHKSMPGDFRVGMSSVWRQLGKSPVWRQVGKSPVWKQVGKSPVWRQGGGPECWKHVAKLPSYQAGCYSTTTAVPEFRMLL